MKRKITIFVTLILFIPCVRSIAQSYAPLPFYENFEKIWVNKSGTRDVPSLYWTNTPVTTDLSWSRNDDGYARGAWSDNSFATGTATSGANNSLRYARFHSGKATLGKSGVLDVKVDFSGYTDSKTLSFWYINSLGVDTLSVYLSTNGGLTFGSFIKKLYNSTTWTKINIPLGTQNSSTCVIRFAATSDLSSDIGIDEVCVTTPTTPIAVNFGVNRISGTMPLAVQFTDSSSLDITSWSWDFDNDGTVDATTKNPSYTYSKAGSYTVSLTCTRGTTLQTSSKKDYVVVADQPYASLPFFEDFETTWIDRDSVRDVPSLLFRSQPTLGKNSWSRDDDASRTWSTNNGFYLPAGANNSSRSARFHSGETRASGYLDLFVDFSTQQGDKDLIFRYINTSGTDSLQVFLSTDGGSSFGNALTTLKISSEWTRVVLNLGNISTNKGVLRFKATGDYGYSDIGLDQIYIESPSVTPVKADFISDKSGGMAPLTINFSDISTGAPSSWNWDFDNNGKTDASEKNSSFTYTSPGIYTVLLNASKDGSNDTKKKESYIVAGGYASLPFYEDFEYVWVSKDKIRDVPSWYANNTPATGNNSWSRDDDGYNRSAWSYQPYSLGGANGSAHSAQFHSSKTTFKGCLDFYIDFSTLSGSKSMIFWNLNNYGTDSLRVYLSTDGGNTFGSPINIQATNYSWSKVIVDLGDITAKNGVIRFEAKGDFSSSDIAIDDISVVSSDMIAVDAQFTADITEGIAPFKVSFSDKSIGVPTNWEWDFNNDGIVDATTKNPSYTFTVPGVYTVSFTASKKGSSNTISKTSYIVVGKYASLPFLERFENDWINRNSTRDVPSLSVKNSPATGYNSWSRDDDGVARGAWTTMDGAYSPAGADSSKHSARFQSFYSSKAYLDFYIDFSTLSGTKTLTFSHINTNGSDTLRVFLSTDGGTSFNELTYETINTKWKKVTVNLGNISSSTGIIRFRGDNGFDKSDIGLDEVSIGTGTPVDAMFSADVTKGTAPLTVKFKDLSTGTPTSWKWDFDNDGIVDATTQNPTFTYSHTGLFTVKLTVSKAGSYDEVEQTKYIYVSGYAKLPFSENFDDTWISNSGVRDIPCTNAVSTPVTGNSSWSRDDDGVARGAWVYLSGAYSPAGANNSTHSARFHSESASNGKYGSLDFYIDFSSLTGPKLLSFEYINKNGKDSLQVLLSTDGGVTFGAPLTTLKTCSDWDEVVVNMGNIDSKQGVIRFRAYSDYGLSDIGLDQISITGLVDAQFSADRTSGPAPLTVSFSDLSVGNPTSWEWDFDNDGVIDATSQNPTFTYPKSGTYTVKMLVSKTGSSDTEVKTAYITVGTSTEIPFTEELGEPIVFPNPAKEMVNIRFPKNLNSNFVALVLMDSNGKILDIIKLVNQDVYQLNLSKYARGIYFINIITKGKVLKKKITIL
jgi:PKD repeat protein